MHMNGLTGIRRPALSVKCRDQFSVNCIGFSYSVSPKNTANRIPLYCNEAVNFAFDFFTADISHVDGEQAAFCNIHQSLWRQMTERFMKYIQSDINGNACEWI
jgi:hypothetical protein